MSQAIAQVEEMTVATKIEIKSMEKAEYEAGGLMMTRHIPQYYSRLGSSKSRTLEQAELGKELILDLMIESPESTTFAFTDGSYLTNPGPCGTGAVLYPPHQDPIPFPEDDLFSLENLWSSW